MQVNTIRWYGCMLVLFLGVGVGITEAQEFEPFQLEAVLGYESSKNGTDSTVIGGGVAWYFEKVVGRNKPLEERAFLGHTPFGGLVVNQLELDDGAGSKGDGLIYTLAGRYAGEAGERPLTLGASFHAGTIKTDDPIFGKWDLNITNWEGRVGVWFQPDFEVGVLFGKNERESVFTLGTIVSEDTIIGVYAKTVQEINGKFVNIEAGFRNIKRMFPVSPSETNTEFEIGGDYYINPGMAVGAALTVKSGDDVLSEGTTIEVRGSYSAKSMLGAELSVSRFSAGNNGIDDKTAIWFALVYRG